MVDTIQKALNSFYFVAFLFGFGILRYPLGYPRVRLSILYILSVWSIYAYVFYYALTSMLSRVRDFILYFYIIINLLVTMISIIITIREQKKFSILINKLSQVDDTLEELGTPKEYRRMQNSIKWIIIMWFIIIFILWSIGSFCFIEILDDTKGYFITVVLNYTLFINILIDIMVMFLLRYIGTRYDQINDYIKQLSETEECGLRCMWKKSSLNTHHYIHSTENRKRILWTAMHLHSQLCRIALDINDLFDIQMTLQTMSYFVILTTTFYFQYHMMLCLMYTGAAVQWKCLLSCIIMCAFEIIRLISINYIYESVSAKAQKTKSIIHKLTNLICFAKAREEICQFLLQISLRPLKFTGMGLFYFGHKFLFKFFVWVFSVIIFVIQMDTSFIYKNVSSRYNMTCYEF